MPPGVPPRLRLPSPAAGPPTAAIGGSRTVPLWLDGRVPAEAARRPLDRDLDLDVAIVGGGFSGLWTAWYLLELDPGLRVGVLDARYCGAGASGRNGGWCEGMVAGAFEAYAARSSPGEARRLTRAVQDAVDEVGRVSAAAGIDCGFAKGGVVRLARTGPQARRQAEEVALHRAQGFGPADLVPLSPSEAAALVNATGIRGGLFSPHGAALDPGRLARGLAAAVAGRGAVVMEGTRALAVGPGRIDTPGGTVRAPVVIQATEAWTRDLPGQRRRLVPLSSLLVATEPLAPAVLDQVGLSTRPTFADDRLMVIYGQRTDDGRIVFGGRGAPYRFGSRIDDRCDHALGVHRRLARTLVELFPVLEGVPLTHRWGGVLGVPRNWLPGLRFDRRTGLGVLGGYVGEGVAAANLAGRTMAELVCAADTGRTTLPWVGVAWPDWEPEPLRWAGIRSAGWLLRQADRWERRTDRDARAARRLAAALRGRDHRFKVLETSMR